MASNIAYPRSLPYYNMAEFAQLIDECGCYQSHRRLNAKLDRLAKENEAIETLLCIRGIRVINVAALCSAIGRGQQLQSAREYLENGRLSISVQLISNEF